MKTTILLALALTHATAYAARWTTPQTPIPCDSWPCAISAPETWLAATLPACNVRLDCASPIIETDGAKLDVG